MAGNVTSVIHIVKKNCAFHLGEPISGDPAVFVHSSSLSGLIGTFDGTESSLAKCFIFASPATTSQTV